VATIFEGQFENTGAETSINKGNIELSNKDMIIHKRSHICGIIVRTTTVSKPYYHKELQQGMNNNSIYSCFCLFFAGTTTKKNAVFLEINFQGHFFFFFNKKMCFLHHLSNYIFSI